MASISVIILTKNEEKNIGRCLTSLRDLADEILVLDSGSKDRTQEIAEKNGAKVIQVEWKGYGSTKNEGALCAKSEYLFFLDADEALSESLYRFLLSEKKQLSGCYQFARLNQYCGKWIRHGGFYPDMKLRLFPKGAAAWQHEAVHEKIIPLPGYPVTSATGDLLHYSYYSTAEHILRARHYGKLGAIEILRTNKKQLFLRMCFSPAARFLKAFFLRLGFLDGYKGFLLICITSYEVFLKYWWAWNMKRKNDTTLYG